MPATTKRRNPDTSKLSYDKIMRPGARESHYRKIITALQQNGKGSSYQIAAWANMKPDRIWKRQSELIRAGIIFDTGLRGTSTDGNECIVYDLIANFDNYVNVPDTQWIGTGTTAADFASMIVASKNKKPVQTKINFDKADQVPILVLVLITGQIIYCYSFTEAYINFKTCLALKNINFYIRLKIKK